MRENRGTKVEAAAAVATTAAAASVQWWTQLLMYSHAALALLASLHTAELRGFKTVLSSVVVDAACRRSQAALALLSSLHTAQLTHVTAVFAMLLWAQLLGLLHAALALRAKQAADVPAHRQLRQKRQD
jgi:hypothetical protein